MMMAVEMLGIVHLGGDFGKKMLASPQTIF
jgi:hypothetical protein